MTISGKHTTEKSFTTAWLKELRSKGYYADKVSDGGVGLKKVDCYIKTDKDVYCCEIKVIDNEILHLNKIRPNQWASLRKWYSLPGYGSSIVNVFSIKHQKYKIIPFKVIADLDINGSIKLAFDK